MPVIPENTCIESGQGTAICFPARYQDNPKNNHFIFAVTGDKNDEQIIKDTFQEKSAAVRPLPDITKIDEANKGWRFYEVTDALPPQVREKLWRDASYPGPNCYGSALTSRLSEFGLMEYIGERYVDDSEAEFLLSLFFKPVPVEECNTKAGGVLAFESSGRSLQFMPEWRQDLIRFMTEKYYYRVKSHPELLTQKHVFQFDIKTEEWFKHGVIPKRRVSEMFMLLAHYSAGVHMAFSLGATAVFHKLNFYMRDGYKVDTIASAPRRMEEASDLRNRDKFERRTDPFKPSNFSSTCYMLDQRHLDAKGRLELPHGKANISPERREYFLKLFNFYSDRVRVVEDSLRRERDDGVAFHEMRPSLLTVENYWQTLRDFNKEIGNDPKNALQFDWELASSFYKAKSLSYELRTMSDEYFPIKETNTEKRLNEMYEKYYFRFDDSFRAEVFAHLDARKVPKGLWGDIYKVLTENLAKKYRPLDYAQSNGGRGAPFFNELEDAIIQCSSR